MARQKRQNDGEILESDDQQVYFQTKPYLKPQGISCENLLRFFGIRWAIPLKPGPIPSDSEVNCAIAERNQV